MSEPMSDAELEEQVQDATGAFLIEMAFLVPRGTPMGPESPIGSKLLAVKRAIESRAKEPLLAEVRRLRGEKDKLVSDYNELLGAHWECKDLRARLAQYEPEEERDETLCCSGCGNERPYHTKNILPWPCYPASIVPRWRYLAAQRILEGKQ